MALAKIERLLKQSAARRKIRSGYATGLEVCASGFMSGVVLLLISAGGFLLISLFGAGAEVGDAFTEGVGAITDFFRMRLFDGRSVAGAAMNLGLISFSFGVLGAMAGAILRQAVRREPSDSFFRKKMRVPVDFFPFLAFFLYAGFVRLDFLAVYVAAAMTVGYLWRFWHRVVLSLVSSLDVSRYIPKPL